MTDRLPIYLPTSGIQEEMSSAAGDKFPRALIPYGLSVVHANAIANNIDVALDTHTVIDNAIATDTVTLPSADTSATPTIGDLLEVYNDTGFELVLAKQVADLYEGSPSTVIPDQTGFTAKITDNLTWEVVGTGDTGSSLTVVKKAAVTNNIDVSFDEHTVVTTAIATDTVTIADATGDIGDTLEVYNASGSELVLSKQAGDAYLGSPSTIIPAETGFRVTITAANEIEVVGTGEISSGLTVVKKDATANNVDVVIAEHTVIGVASASDTVTLPTATDTGDRLQVYNNSGFELVLAKQVADSYLGTPSAVIPDQTGFEAVVTAANEWEVVGTGEIGSSLVDNLVTFTANNTALTDGNHDRADGTSGAAASDAVTIPTAQDVGATGQFFNATGFDLVLAKDAGDAYLGTVQTEIPANTGFTWRFVASNVVEVVGTGELGSSLIDNLVTFTTNNTNLTAGNHDRGDATSGATAIDTVTLPANPDVGSSGEFFNATGLELAIAKDAGDAYLGTVAVEIPDNTGFSWRAVAANVIEVVGTGDIQSGLSVVKKNATTNNIDTVIGEHTIVGTAILNDTVTLPAAGDISDILEVYNNSGFELVLAKQVADAYLGSPSTIIPDQTGFRATVSAANEWEVVGTGELKGALTDNLVTFTANNTSLTADNHDRADGTSGAVLDDTVTLPTAPEVGERGEFFNSSGVNLILAKDAGDAYLGDVSTVILDNTGFAWRCVSSNIIEVVGTGDNFDLISGVTEIQPLERFTIPERRESIVTQMQLDGLLIVSGKLTIL